VDCAEENGTFVFRFTNEEFGKTAANLNQLEGRWLTLPSLAATRMVVVLVFVGLIMAIVGGISIARRFQSGKFWLSVPLSLLLLVGGSAIEAVSLYFWNKQRKGMEQKPLKIPKKPDGSPAPETQTPMGQP
jgi:hypothetical protein